MNTNTKDDSLVFQGKASLMTLLGGLGVWGLGLVLGQTDVAIMVLLVAIVVSLILGVLARRNRIGKATMYLSGAMLVYALVSYVLFLRMAHQAETDLMRDAQGMQNQAMHSDGGSAAPLNGPTVGRT